MPEKTPRLIATVTNQLAQIGQDSIYRSRFFIIESLRLRPSRAAALDSTRNRSNACDFTGNVANSQATPSFGL